MLRSFSSIEIASTAWLLDKDEYPQ
jgi:hypothetical protein